MRTLFAVLLCCAATLAWAQSQYPVRPVRVVITFSPGSATDVVGRAVAERLGAIFGQQFIADNRTGAGGTIGMGVVASATPDGYTLLVNSGAQTVVDALYAKLPFDTAKDFAGITMLASMPGVLVASQPLGVRTVAELVALGKGRAKPFAFGSAGTGSSTHLLLEKFRMASGIAADHIPYKGSPDAMIELGAGRIDLTIQPPSIVLPMVRERRAVPLAVTSPRRFSGLPEVQTMAEAGYPGVDYQIWMGLFAPARVPAAVLDRIHAATATALASDEVKARFAAVGMEPVPQTRAEFAKQLAAELVDNLRVLRAAGVRPN